VANKVRIIFEYPETILDKQKLLDQHYAPALADKVTVQILNEKDEVLETIYLKDKSASNLNPTP